MRIGGEAQRDRSVGGSAKAVAAAIGAGAMTFAVLAAPVVAVVPAAPAMTATERPAEQDQLRGKVAAARQQLATASAAVESAEDAADAAAAKMPEASAALKRAVAGEAAAVRAQAPAKAAHEQALAAKATADRSRDQAQEEVRRAQEAVTAQRGAVSAAEARMGEVKSQIALLARQQYISGAESVELGILMQSRSPSDFADQLQAIARISRGNSVTFDEILRLQAALAAQLEQLTVLDLATADSERAAQVAADGAMQRASEARVRADEMQARTADAQASRDAAASAKAAVATLVAERERELSRALSLRRDIKSMYERLQTKLLSAQGVAKTHGTGRSAKEALAWGMDYVGSGANYNGLCLGFVDDAYDPPSGRVGTAIAQWYRAKAAGLAHPGDRNPPVGAQVFWWSGNPARHVALYAGGGMVLTTGAEGGRVGLVTMQHLDSYGPYLGWAEAYYG